MLLWSQSTVGAAQALEAGLSSSPAAMDHIALEVWLSHATPYLYARERLSLCQLRLFASAPAVLKEARGLYRRAMNNVSQMLAPLGDQTLSIPGLSEASRAIDIHFAGCDEYEYLDNVPAVWDKDARDALDFEEWVEAVDVEADCFPHILFELNPEDSLILVELVQWLDSNMTAVAWFPENWETGEPTTIIAVFNTGDVEGSVCWVEPFVDPAGCCV